MGPYRVATGRVWRLLILLTILSAGVPASGAQPGATVVESVSLGFAGHYKVGYWTPVFVEINAEGRAGEVTVDVTVPDGDGVPSTTTVNAPLAGESSVVVELVAKIGRIDGDLSVLVRDGDETLGQARFAFTDLGPPPLPADAQLFVAIGETPNINRALAEQSGATTDSFKFAQLTDDNRLPTQACGYEGVDLVIVCGSRPQVAALNAAAPAASALAEWIRNGGRLLMSIGSEADDLLVGETPLAALSPGEFVQLIAIRQLEPLETFADSADPLFAENENAQPRDFQVPLLEDAQGAVLAAAELRAQKVPLLVRSALGFGQVTFLAIDLESPELRVWNGTRKLVGKLVFSEAADAGQQRGVPGELAQVGYDDLSGQLRGALDQYQHQGVRFIPFELLFVLGVVYILLIAPGDYFFLKRVLGRMELTWITFPVLVVLACVGTYYLARFTKGDRRLLNQAELIDVDVAGGLVRADSWFSIYSPQSQGYDLSVRFRLPTDESTPRDARNQSGSVESNEQVLLSWLGLPGTALGGMQSSAATQPFDSAYRFGPRLETMHDVPIQIWSTKSFVAHVTGTTAASMQSTLVTRALRRDQRLSGTITNPLSIPLSDATLFHGSWVYPLGTIEAGQTVTVGKDEAIRTIRNHLTRFGDWESETDEQRSDVSRILNRMVFYEAAGGRDATPLKNRYMSAVDMTSLLSEGRAVMVAEAKEAAFQVFHAEEMLSYPQALRASMYRFVLPVRQVAYEESSR